MLLCPNAAFSHGGVLESKALCPTTCDKDRNKLQGLLLEETLENLVKYQSPSYQRDSPGSNGCHAITLGRSPREFPLNVVFQTFWAWERLCTKMKSVRLANSMGNEAWEAMWHRKSHHSLLDGYFWDMCRLDYMIVLLLCGSEVGSFLSSLLHKSQWVFNLIAVRHDLLRTTHAHTNTWNVLKCLNSQCENKFSKLDIKCKIQKKNWNI